MATLADGSRLGLPELRRAEQAAYRERFGPCPRGYAKHLSEVAPDTAEDADLYFKPDLDWTELSPRLTNFSWCPREA